MLKEEKSNLQDRSARHWDKPKGTGKSSVSCPCACCRVSFRQAEVIGKRMKCHGRRSNWLSNDFHWCYKNYTCSCLGLHNHQLICMSWAHGRWRQGTDSCTALKSQVSAQVWLGASYGNNRVQLGEFCYLIACLKRLSQSVLKLWFPEMQAGWASDASKRPVTPISVKHYSFHRGTERSAWAVASTVSLARCWVWLNLTEREQWVHTGTSTMMLN